MTETFFDKDFRLEELERCGDPLTKLNDLIPWEDFRPKLETLRTGEDYRKSPAGREVKAMGFRPRLQHKGCRNKSLSEREIQGNRTRAKIRSRIEHVFGIQTRRAGNLIIRTIGIARAKVKIGLRNLAYNLDRYASFMEGKRVEELLKA